MQAKCIDISVFVKILAQGQLGRNFAAKATASIFWDNGSYANNFLVTTTIVQNFLHFLNICIAFELNIL